MKIHETMWEVGLIILFALLWSEALYLGGYRAGMEGLPLDDAGHWAIAGGIAIATLWVAGLGAFIQSRRKS